ncbi:hypothetical protein AX16_006597 [Volvariella volvacea WC 439]|nr:hypothetical protein AX16_006597 [Volvariella volvacea WC 439]
MATVQEFETALQDAVHKRLSANKMEKIKEIAFKCIEHDTQLVSILYRTHKSLPPPSKVNSLYVFDALARTARQQVTKQGITGDLHTEPGNAATFLLKVEGILDGLFQDMIKTGNLECKEKAKKIYDIWVKGGTFPPTILARLSDVVNEKEQVPEVTTPPTMDPRLNVAGVVPTAPALISPVTPATPTPTSMDPQATLLALLTQAAKAANITPQVQTPTNTTTTFAPVAPSAGPLDPTAAQLALLQRLAQSAKGNNIPQPPVTQNVNAPPVQSPITTSGPVLSPPPPFKENPAGRDSRYERYRSPEAAFDRDRDSRRDDDRYSSRGGYRGGFRGRGRGDARRPYRNRRSRSRSPPTGRYGGRRDIKPYSPPRRPSLAQYQEPAPGPRLAASAGPDKDEFGRDIRPASPDSTSSRTPPPSSQPPKQPLNPQPQQSPSTFTSDEKPVVESTPATNHDRMSMSPLVAGNTSANNHNASLIPNTQSSDQAGMEGFDISTFDLTSASSWEALGKRWLVTNGYTPSTEELMQFVMTKQMAVANQYNGEQSRWAGGDWDNSSGSHQHHQRGAGGRGRGGARGGRGGGYYGKGRGEFYEGAGWGQAGMGQHTDAVVLGGDTYPDNEQEQNFTSDNRTEASGHTGKMQKVGDKWVFVREPASSSVS